MLSSCLIVTEFRKVIIIGDSIIKNIPPMEGVVVKSFPGATIGRLSQCIDKKLVDLSKFNYVIVHVGTNNINNRSSVAHMTADIANLVALIRRRRGYIHIIISAILPRPVDHALTDGRIKEFNRILDNVMSKDLHFKFIRTYRPFCFKGQPRRYLFAKLDGGLHLNTEGSGRLGHFYHRVISTLSY